MRTWHQVAHVLQRQAEAAHKRKSHGLAASLAVASLLVRVVDHVKNK